MGHSLPPSRRQTLITSSHHTTEDVYPRTHREILRQCSPWKPNLSINGCRKTRSRGYRQVKKTSPDGMHNFQKNQENGTSRGPRLIIRLFQSLRKDKS